MTETQPRRIQQLSPGVVNKIAAGEVIERPASVVKELLENSIDAGASRIQVAIENGGIDLIRITDDGCGIPRDQLELAVTSHATSKITNAEDLFRVSTFGFRGEALASVSEVSQFLLRSRPAESDCGFELRVHGGQREEIAATGCPIGTTIEVRNLLFNTPVRRKFLRTAQTERGHIVEAFTRIALANPSVPMSLSHNGTGQYDLPPADDWRDRISDFFGPEISSGLLPIISREGDISLTGFVVDPAVNRANNRMQYLFLNGRYIRDRSLQHALGEAYRGLLMTGRYPIVFLRLDMPPELVDVNVHPAKLEVRFQDGGKLYSQLLGSVRGKFLSTDLTARARLSQPESLESHLETQGAEAAALPLPPSQGRMPFRSTAQPIDWTRRPRESATYEMTPGIAPPAGMPTRDPRTRIDPPAHKSMSDNDPGHISLPHHAQTHGQRLRPTALQVHNTYLISETEDGMVVVDQHALHERIIYEQLREKVLAGKLETQRLLVPEPVSLPPAEAAAILENAELLNQIGMTVEPFGGDTVIVAAYPAMLSNQNPAEMLRSVVELVMAEGRQVDQRDLVDQLLHMISCKAAVKAGDRLTPEEINDLLDHRQYCQDSHHCPHGRPTALVFSREELDRRFKRV